MITEKQRKVLEFINRCVSEKEYPPTIREIAFGLSVSIATVQWHLKKLQKENYLEKTHGGARTLVPSQKERGVPIVGRIAAGGPTLAFQEIEGYLPASEGSANSGEFFALRVRGDSMIGAGILEGDVVVLRQQQTAQNGDIVAALLGEDATLKRLKRNKNGFVLQAENPKYKPILVNEFQILGKVVKVIRNYL